jgi:hypothetical protein
MSAKKSGSTRPKKAVDGKEVTKALLKRLAIRKEVRDAVRWTEYEMGDGSLLCEGRGEGYGGALVVRPNGEVQVKWIETAAVPNTGRRRAPVLRKCPKGAPAYERLFEQVLHVLRLKSQGYSFPEAEWPTGPIGEEEVEFLARFGALAHRMIQAVAAGDGDFFKALADQIDSAVRLPSSIKSVANEWNDLADHIASAAQESGRNPPIPTRREIQADMGVTGVSDYKVYQLDRMGFGWLPTRADPKLLRIKIGSRTTGVVMLHADSNPKKAGTPEPWPPRQGKVKSKGQE